MEGRLGLIVREAKCLWCGCCALRAGGVSLVVGVEVRSGSILMVSPSTLTIPHSLHHSQLLLPISREGWANHYHGDSNEVDNCVSLRHIRKWGREREREDGGQRGEEEERQMNQEGVRQISTDNKPVQTEVTLVTFTRQKPYHCRSSHHSWNNFTNSWGERRSDSSSLITQPSRSTDVYGLWKYSVPLCLRSQKREFIHGKWPKIEASLECYIYKKWRPTLRPQSYTDLSNRVPLLSLVFAHLSCKTCTQMKYLFCIITFKGE